VNQLYATECVELCAIQHWSSNLVLLLCRPPDYFDVDLNELGNEDASTIPEGLLMMDDSVAPSATSKGLQVILEQHLQAQDVQKQ
jgi:hypothetical protein